MKKSISVLLLSLIAIGTANATPTYVGNWHVGDGPVWTSNPDVLNAQETAALLFGGSALDYVISTISDQVSDINYMSFVDGWGDDHYLYAAVAQDYKLDSGAPGYNAPYGGPAYSAYVLDHSCANRYGDSSLTCANDEPGLNYAFRVNNDVPEPATLVLLGVGLAGLGFSRRKFKG